MTAKTKALKLLDLPPHYNPAAARNANYQADAAQILTEAAKWRKDQNLKPVASDQRRVHVLDIDDQFDFDFPAGTLFVSGRSGTGGMDAAKRRVEFIYRYLGVISQITNTMDTHLPFQVFYGSAHLNRDGDHPAPHTVISAADYMANYRPNPAMAAQIGVDAVWLQRQFNYYCQELEKSGKYQLYIWPYHCMLGSPGHRLAGVMEEARLFHCFARGAENLPEIKGGNPLTEHYSIFAPEVTTTWDGRPIPGAQKNVRLIKALLSDHRVFIMGEAASHCVRTSVADFLTEVQSVDPALAKKVVILRDCTTAVVVPGVVDFTDEAERAIQNFQDAGMNVVDSTDEGAIEELILRD